MPDDARQAAIDDGPFGQPGICSECGEDSYEVDEATELCLTCFEFIMGDDHAR